MKSLLATAKEVSPAIFSTKKLTLDSVVSWQKCLDLARTIQTAKWVHKGVHRGSFEPRHFAGATWSQLGGCVNKICRVWILLAFMSGQSVASNNEFDDNSPQYWAAFGTVTRNKIGRQIHKTDFAEVAVVGIDKAIGTSFSASGSFFIFAREGPAPTTVWPEIHGSLNWFKPLPSTWYFRDGNDLELAFNKLYGGTDYIQRAEIGKLVCYKRFVIVPSLAWQPDYDVRANSWTTPRFRFSPRLRKGGSFQFFPFYDWSKNKLGIEHKVGLFVILQFSRAHTCVAKKVRLRDAARK